MSNAYFHAQKARGWNLPHSPAGVLCVDEDGAPLGFPLGFHEERAEAVPREAPAGWVPDEYVPEWEFCERGDKGAIPIYVCEEAPDG